MAYELNVRTRGTMLWFNRDGDRGVVEAENGERLTVTSECFAETLPGPRCNGTPVSFRGVDGQATDVTFTPEPQGGRARSHRSGGR